MFSDIISMIQRTHDLVEKKDEEDRDAVAIEDMRIRMEESLNEADKDEKFPIWLTDIEDDPEWKQICFGDMYPDKSMDKMHVAATALVQKFLELGYKVKILPSFYKERQNAYECEHGPDDEKIPLLLCFTEYIAVKLGKDERPKKRKISKE